MNSISECNDCKLSNSLEGDVATDYGDSKLFVVETFPGRYLFLCNKCNRYWEMTWENPGGQDYGRTTLRKHAVSELANRWPSHLLLQPERVRGWKNLVSQSFDFLLRRDCNFYRVEIPRSDFFYKSAKYVGKDNLAVVTSHGEDVEVILFSSVVPPGNGFRLTEVLIYLGLFPSQPKNLESKAQFAGLGNLINANWDQIHQLFRNMPLEELVRRFGSNK